MKIALFALGFSEIDLKSAIYIYLHHNKEEHESLIESWPENDDRKQPSFKEYVQQKIELHSPVNSYLLHIPVAEITAMDLPDSIDVTNDETINNIKNNIIDSKYSWAWSIKHGIKYECFIFDLDLENLDNYQPGKKIKIDLLSIISEDELKIIAEKNKDVLLKLNQPDLKEN